MLATPARTVRRWLRTAARLCAWGFDVAPSGNLFSARRSTFPLREPRSAAVRAFLLAWREENRKGRFRVELRAGEPLLVGGAGAP